MADVTVTTSQNLEQVIALGMTNGDRLTINGGAVITCTQTPSILMSLITVTDGELIIDGLGLSHLTDSNGDLLLDSNSEQLFTGEGLTTGNNINFVGEGGLTDSSNDQTITVNGQGKLTINGDWFSAGTTDGSDSQVIDLSLATGSNYWDSDFCVSNIPMIQVETGRRINYDTPTGTTPIAGDWVYLTSDRTTMGKVHSVGAGFIVVWLLTGTLADNDAIQCRKVVDNFGPDLQVTWTALVNDVSGDIKEAGVYMEFGSVTSDNVNYIAGFGNGYGGLVFHQEFATTSIIMGGAATGGFIPPTGCNIRIPNVNVNTASIADYDLGNATHPLAQNDENEWYELECTAGGTIDLSICNLGNAIFADASAFAFDAEYVGAVVEFGSSKCGSRSSYNHCVIAQDPVGRALSGTKPIFMAQDLVNGTDISFCMSIQPQPNSAYIGAITSIDVNISDCIYSANGSGTALTTSANYAYYFSGVNTSSSVNNMAFMNNHAETDQTHFTIGGNNHTCEMFLFSATQDYSEGTVEKDSLVVQSCPDSIVTGIEIIGDGNGGNDLVRLTDISNFKLRAVGMIDDKVSLGVDGEYAVNIAGLCANVDIARVWKTDGVTEECILIPTTAKDVTIQNCSGKYASEIQASGGDNIRLKGLHGGSGTFGGAIGWEDALLACYGNSTHDGFQSDTNGSLACLMITPSTTTNETTIIAGNPRFFKDGDLDMTAGDIVEFTQGYFAKGHTGFTGNFTASTGTAGYFADEWGNVTLEFQWQLDGGSWNGTWLDVRVPANLTAITGAIEAGIKFKYRFTATGTQSSMSGLLIDTTTSLTAQKNNMYKIDQVESTFTFTISPAITSYEWRIYTVDTKGSLAGSVEVAGQESATLSTQSYTYPFVGDVSIAVQIISQPDQDYEEETRFYTLSSNDQSVSILLAKDNNN